MQYRQLGHTGLKVSALSLGASSLGGVFHEIDESKASEVVVAALDGGINLIDVSPYYGHYRAERVLGRALRQIPRDRYFLSTKVGRYGEKGVNTWDYSGRRAKESVCESMERLGVDYIDLIHVHDIEFQASLPGGLQKVVDETLPALAELKAEGLVGHVGITDLQLSNLKWIVENSPEGLVETVLNFCHYCLCDDSLADNIDYFERHDVGLINASPLSMGLLSERGVPAWHPAPQPLVEACRRAAAHCKQRGYPIERLALQFAVSNPRIPTTLFSSANPDNVRRNLQFISEPIDWQLVDEVKKIIGDQQRVTWANT